MFELRGELKKAEELTGKKGMTQEQVLELHMDEVRKYARVTGRHHPVSGSPKLLTTNLCPVGAEGTHKNAPQ